MLHLKIIPPEAAEQIDIEAYAQAKGFRLLILAMRSMTVLTKEIDPEKKRANINEREFDVQLFFHVEVLDPIAYATLRTLGLVAGIHAALGIDVKTPEYEQGMRCVMESLGVAENKAIQEIRKGLIMPGDTLPN